MKLLKISKEISLPISAVTETCAAIGRRGAGKSYLATMIAEQMLDARAQVVVIDPVGIWWGLRVGADGKSKGKEIFVIGGEHGDVPLVPEAGKRVAQLVAEKEVSAVIDVSGFRMGEHKRFAADFAEEFFHLKKSRKTPVHVFIEEAQTLIPQRVGADEARMVGAFERIVRLGRNYGIGCTLITQRPQSVNKEVLSQVECLFVLQVTGLHERKALEGWVQEHGADRKLVGELPSLGRGEGYVWSPSFLRIYKRVTFSKKETFDASATPVVGKETKSASIQAVDVEKLRKDMADVVAKAELDDPAALRKRIRELEKGKQPAAVVTSTDPKAVEKAVTAALAQQDREFEKERKQYRTAIEQGEKKLEQIGRIIGTKVERIEVEPRTVKVILPPVVVAPVRRSESSDVEGDGTGKLGLCERKIYSFLHENQGRNFSKVQLGAVTGYSPTSGGFNNALGKLNTAGLIQRDGGLVSFSQLDEAQLMPSEKYTPEIWFTKLGKCPREVFQFLWDNPDAEFTKEEVGNAVNYSPTSGGFNNALGHLNSLGLIRRVAGKVTLNREIIEI